MTSDPEEWLDLVDDDDNVIGRKLRSEHYAEGSHHFRVVYGFIRNGDGKLWVPRRAAHKQQLPLHLDMSVSGHVGAGESYDEAFHREAMEEVRLDTKNLQVRTLGRMSPPKDGAFAFFTAYEIAYDQVPDYNPEDFCEWQWLTPQELMAKFNAGEKVKTDIPLILYKFYLSAQ